MTRPIPARAGARPLILLALAVGAVLLWLSMQAPTAQAARGLQLGFFDPDFTTPASSTRTTAFDRAVQARAGLTLIYVDWSRVAPNNRPNNFDATDPSDPRYHFNVIDDAVRDAAARGLTILMSFTTAPRWAEGPNRPPTQVGLPDTALPGTWQPNPSDVGDFARALAIRYSGNFEGLPAVRNWQLWAEPNLAVNLGPQFIGNTPVGFEVYRPMLNAFYANLKAVNPRNVVVTGGTAPYGGLTPSRGLVYQRMQPLQFWRGLVCLKAGKKGKKKKGRRQSARLRRVPGCTPARFDVAGHHPINVGAPTRPALNADDVSTPDIGKLRRVIRAGVGNRPIWATEMWWNSNPPSRGVPLMTQARYLEQGFYLMWKQHVPVAVWFQVRDMQPDQRTPIPTSGVFFRDGQPKPSLRAYQFPFVTERISKSRLRAWGIAPRPGKVKVQLMTGHGFRSMRGLKAGANRVFVGTVRLGRKGRLRAKQGGETSLIWRQK